MATIQVLNVVKRSYIILLIISTFTNMVYSIDTSRALSGASMVEERLKDRGSVLSAEDTMSLIKEAESWRWGLHNRSVDDGRAISLYWGAASSGQGPAIGAALNELAWLHLVPSRMSKPLKGGTLGESLAEEIDEVHDRDLGWGEWATLVAKNYFGIHLSQLWLVSIGRRFGWLEGGSDSEFSEFSELSTMQTGPKPDRDVEAAIALWLEGAKVGNADAQHALATHLASPAFLGVEGRDGKVGSLLRDYFAALGGTTLAQMTLGYRHLMGYGVPKSCETAATFYELAANQAVLAMRKMSGDYPGLIVLPPGDALGVRLSEQGETAPKETDKEVVQFFEAAALAGDSAAVLNLGHIYLSGSRGVTQDIDKAVRMYRRALKMNNGASGASGILGALTYGGVGVKKSCERAAAIWRDGVVGGDPASVTGLGVYHSRDCGSNQANLTLASEYWEKAAQKGHMDGLYLLGMHYLKMADASHAHAMRLHAETNSFPAGQTHDEMSGDGKAVALFHKDFAARGVAREVAQRARHAARGLKSEKSLKQRQKEAVLMNLQLDLEKEKTIAQSEADFADREEARWLKAYEREEARLYADAQMRDKEADSARSASDRRKALEKEAKMMTKTLANQMHKATSCLSTAAQHGHVLALHQMGLLYSEGKGVAMNCASAVQSLKSVAERGQPTASMMASALALYKANDPAGARLMYAFIAESGVEMAQSNAAWLLERSFKPNNWESPLNVCGTMDRRTCEKAALHLWKQAAKQMNADAALMVGDYSYYGRGDFEQTSSSLNPQVKEVLVAYAPWMMRHVGAEGDPSTAAKYYSLAAEMKSPQAIFNLAFMYHLGIGVERDLHLAKRYYDASAATHPHAAWPAKIGLAALQLEFLVQSLEVEAPTSSINQAQEIKWGGVDISWSDELASFDTLVVIVLTSLLLLTLRLRRHQQEHNRGLADGANAPLVD